MENAADALAQQIEQLRTERKQERFFFIFAITALIDVIIANSMSAASLAIFVPLSLIFLACIASWLEVPWAVVHFERWLSSLGKKNNGTE